MNNGLGARTVGPVDARTTLKMGLDNTASRIEDCIRRLENLGHRAGVLPPKDQPLSQVAPSPESRTLEETCRWLDAEVSSLVELINSLEEIV